MALLLGLGVRVVEAQDFLTLWMAEREQDKEEIQVLELVPIVPPFLVSASGDISEIYKLLDLGAQIGSWPHPLWEFVSSPCLCKPPFEKKGMRTQ